QSPSPPPAWQPKPSVPSSPRPKRGRHGLGHHHHAPAPAVPRRVRQLRSAGIAPTHSLGRLRPMRRPGRRVSHDSFAESAADRKARSASLRTLENHARAAALADGTEPPEMDGILSLSLISLSTISAVTCALSADWADHTA